MVAEHWPHLVAALSHCLAALAYAAMAMRGLT